MRAAARRVALVACLGATLVAGCGRAGTPGAADTADVMDGADGAQVATSQAERQPATPGAGQGPVALLGHESDGPTAEVLRAARESAAVAGADLAGSYWDAEHHAMVVRVADTPRGARTETARGARTDTDRVGEAAPAAGVRLEHATYPLAELRELAARTDPDVAESYVDEPANRVVLVARPGRTAAVASRAADPRITVRTAASEPVPAAGGSPLVGGGAACTMGFTGSLRGVPVFLTAGHCGKQGTTFTSNGNSAGRVTDVVFPESDYAVGVFEGAGPRGVVATGPRGSIPVRGSLEAPVGARVCTMGSSSGWACGTIVATGVTVRYGDGGAAQYVHGLTKVAVCRSGGDSGGPWLWGTQAQGLTSGGAGSHGPGCAGASGDQVAYLQPLNPVLEATGVVLDTAAD